MATDEPLVSILLAVYHPRPDWLIEQLDSLNAQTYPNLELIICDDGPDASAEEDLFREHIRAFPWQLIRNKENLGSNRCFEIMTEMAEGDYLCYCDQDDIWLPEKTERLLGAIREEQANLVCSDMFIIDEQGEKTADSITQIRRHHVFRSGVGLTDTLWYSNFASGCALMVRASLAKAAVPFDPYMYYDHYITLFCANAGKVVSLPDRLLLHREHSGNQSSLMKGVTDRESYYRIRVDKPAAAVIWLEENFPAEEKLKPILTQGREWMEARRDYARGRRECRKTIWRYRSFSPKASLLEIAMPYLPQFVLKLCFWLSRRNMI